MIIIMVSPPTRAEIAAALASGFAVEYRRGEPWRYISTGEHHVELAALGDRLGDAVLTRERRPAPWPSSRDGADPLSLHQFAILSGYLDPE